MYKQWSFHKQTHVWRLNPKWFMVELVLILDLALHAPKMAGWISTRDGSMKHCYESHHLQLSLDPPISYWGLPSTLTIDMIPQQLTKQHFAWPLAAVLGTRPGPAIPLEPTCSGAPPGWCLEAICGTEAEAAQFPRAAWALWRNGGSEVGFL